MTVKYCESIFSWTIVTKGWLGVIQFCNFINNLEEDIKFGYDTIGRISTLESRIKIHQKRDRKVTWIKPNNINSSR